MLRPLSLVGLISFTRRDEVNGCSDTSFIHLEQVDSLEALRRLGVIRAMLYQIVCRFTTVTCITLCVSRCNLIAQAAYRKMDFSGFDLLPESENLLAFLEEAVIERLRAGPAPSSSLPLSFTSLGSEGSRAELNEMTMKSCNSAAAAAKPSRELAFSTMGLALCAANLSKRHLLERDVVKSPKDCESEALSLITASGSSEAVDCIAALLPRVDVQLAQVWSLAARVRARARDERLTPPPTPTLTRRDCSCTRPRKARAPMSSCTAKSKPGKRLRLPSKRRC